MTFQAKTKISIFGTLNEFFSTIQLSSKDLIITNEHLFTPNVKGDVPCHIIYQESFGTGEPTDEMVDDMLKSIKGMLYGRVIAIGGGTVLDIAKLFVFGDNLVCDEIFEKGTTLPKKRELIAIPTTCGTGSEVTMISVVRFIKKNTKMGLAVPAIFADEAILIPSLLMSQPYDVFASSSIDALVHAVESYVSPKATVFSRAMGVYAMKLIINGFKEMKNGGKRVLPPLNTMQQFLEGSTLAGIAFGNAGCGAVHALSYPVGATYHVAHGKSNYMFFSAVFMEYKRKGADLINLEDVLASILECSKEIVWDELISIMDFMLDIITLSSLGANADDCKFMAASVMKNQQRLLVNNPIQLTEEELYEVYLKCL